MYPEYLLLDSATGVMDSASITTTTSGVSSAGTTLGEIETEFKRELAASAKEYMQTVKRGDEAASSTSGRGATSGDAASTTSGAGTATPAQPAKLAAWLFDKQIVEDMLKQSSYPTTSLYVKSSDFSLSVNYLQQTMATIQTSLRYRSPFSCSYDSLAAINSNLPVIDLVNQNALGAKGLQSRGYN